MGTLVAMHYPTSAGLGAVDHTYVRCGTGGKAWGCFGGKTGGSVLRSGSGSTNQADAIAEPNERAGVTCYLVNGVCHQAANRILFPAGIFVTGARGYGLSAAIYGPYGRPTGVFGTCLAPFNRHVGVTGDLPQCLAPLAAATTTEAIQPPEEKKYFERVSAAYGEVRPLALRNEGLALRNKGREDTDLVELMIQLFDYKIEYRLGDKLDRRRHGQLREFRVSAERSRMRLEKRFAKGTLKPSEFVAASDRGAISFQKNAAKVLKPEEYQALFDLKHGEFVGLADPEIVAKVYRR